MNRLRNILLSGLVALLMVGMVVADDLESETGSNDYVERTHIGMWTGKECVESTRWDCLHLEFTFQFDIPFL